MVVVTRVVATEMLTRVTGVIGVTVDLVEVGDSVLVLASAGCARRRRQDNASVMTHQPLTRGTSVIGVTVNPVEVGDSVLVLTSARGVVQWRCCYWLVWEWVSHSSAAALAVLAACCQANTAALAPLVTPAASWGVGQ